MLYQLKLTLFSGSFGTLHFRKVVEVEPNKNDGHCIMVWSMVHDFASLQLEKLKQRHAAVDLVREPQTADALSRRQKMLKFKSC